MSNNNTSSGGIGFLGVLTIVFIVLKLTGYIAWSWWLVLSPLWLPITLVIGGVLIYFAVIYGAALCVLIYGNYKNRKK